jgi:tRNA (cytidine32/uridine32-2'-O)-methyltransferase
MNEQLLDSVRIVMVNTTHPGNVGAAARAMRTMGIGDLALVDPVAKIDAEAVSRASRAEDILERAHCVSTLEEAIQDCALVIGTSARSRHIPWPLMTPRQAGQLAKKTAVGESKVALVFGRESSGLTNEELHLCHAHVHIPTEASYSSLNVAQAIQILCYEMRLAALATDEDDSEQEFRGVAWDHPPATHGELNAMLLHLEQALVDIGFLDPNNPKQLMTRLRRLFQRALPDRMEINILRGFFGSVQQRVGKPKGVHSVKQSPEPQASDKEEF